MISFRLEITADRRSLFSSSAGYLRGTISIDSTSSRLIRSPLSKKRFHSRIIRRSLSDTFNISKCCTSSHKQTSSPRIIPLNRDTTSFLKKGYRIVFFSGPYMITVKRCHSSIGSTQTENS